MPQNNGIAPLCVSLCDTYRGEGVVPPLKHLGAITGHLKPDTTVGMAPVLAGSQEWKWLHHLSTTVEALRDCDCAGVHLWGCGTASPHPPSLTFILLQCIPSFPSVLPLSLCHPPWVCSCCSGQPSLVAVQSRGLC